MKAMWLVLFLISVLGCGCESNPSTLSPLPPPPAGSREAGVQVFNHLPRAASINVRAVRQSDHEVLEIVQGLKIPKVREPVNPSLGGDPRAIGYARFHLAPGDWEITVTEDGGTSQFSRVTLKEGGPTWMVAWVSAEGFSSLIDSGPRQLE